MTYQQREEYTAPVCEVLTFEVEEGITVGSNNGKAAFGIGNDAIQEDEDE